MSRFALLAVLAICALPAQIFAGSLEATVKDSKGSPVNEAVVYAKSGAPAAAVAKSTAIIDQRDKQFVPYVTALQVGTSVFFPNSDNIRHHVYSLSPAKKFDLPLYTGVPAHPVVFDNVGFVTLGCNIHDWMVAYVAVLPTRYFQMTGRDGHVHLKNVPPGHYNVEVWHPSLKGAPEKLAQTVEISTGAAAPLTFVVDLKPDLRARRAPDTSRGGYP